MKLDELCAELESVARQLSVEVSYEDLRWEGITGRGGLCRVRGKPLIIINKALPKRERARILARELSRLDLSRLFIPPAVRQWIEKAAQE